MYQKLILELLEKHFGAPKCSAIIGFDGEAGNAKYYYSFDGEKTIGAICKLLNRKELRKEADKIPPLMQSVPEAGEGEKPICVVCNTTDNDGWLLKFYYFAGVRYVQDEEGVFKATLQTDNFPFASLTSGDPEFFGFWKKYRSRRRNRNGERDGFSYWTNKALKTNEGFRGFSVDLFYAVAEAERQYILKDVARAIESCGCFLPPVSYQKLLEFHTPAALVNSFRSPQIDLNVDFNKVDLNVGYVMVTLAPSIERMDWKLIAKLDAKTISGALSLNTFYDGFTAENFVPRYYAKKLEGTTPEYEIKMYADDYVSMCSETHELLRLSYSLQALINAHDEMAARTRMRINEKEFEKPLVKTPSKFDALEASIRQTGTTELERITTTKRLFDESEYQHNCVFSRRDAVRKDSASIYHWAHEGESYTIQFGAKKKGTFYVREIKARFNRRISVEHLGALAELIDGFCAIDADLARDELPQVPIGPLPHEFPAFALLDLDDEELPF
ncbi:MAG: PcfJ domain-containing protein [Oscillospiraceae bacterium]|nr:PcfJ domain-containing protein [Oscillospiraceae bacterium]